MEKVNNYWVDNNNNKWDCRLYTEEEVQKYSDTLIDCFGCRGCINCANCTDCTGCTSCDGCDDCRGCVDCSYCVDCDDCTNCRGCFDCSGYKENPQRYTTPKIGSRTDNTTFYYDGENLQVVCGCFRGNLEEFEKAVLKTHADNDMYREQYLKEIKKVKVLFELGWENK